MSEDVADGDGLFDLNGLSLDESPDESALAQAIKRILQTSSENGPCNSFSSSI